MASSHIQNKSQNPIHVLALPASSSSSFPTLPVPGTRPTPIRLGQLPYSSSSLPTSLPLAGVLHLLCPLPLTLFPHHLHGLLPPFIYIFAQIFPPFQAFPDSYYPKEIPHHSISSPYFSFPYSTSHYLMKIFLSILF